MYPFPVVVDPSGKFAYAANGNSDNIETYSIDPTTGALTSFGTILAGTLPSWLVVTASIH
jgi:6-phosphogluconolactonase (cycloisomerase 2 family)